MDHNLENIYNSYKIRLSVFAYRMVNSVEEAEDIVHNVFLKVHSFNSYIYRAVYNACINFLKKEKRVQLERKDDFFIEEEENYLLKRIEDEVIWELYQAIEKLPSECKKVFKLSYMNKLSNADIAQLLNISINTVKSQKQRAKQLLREDLKDLFVLFMLLLQDF